MKNTFIKAIVEKNEIHSKLIFISVDQETGFDKDLKNKLGERFIMESISEQYVVGFASGLAADGYLPIIFNHAAFTIRRSYEQILLDCCLQNRKVICGSDDILTNLDYIINTQNSVYVRLSKYGKYNLEQYSIYNNSKILYRNYGNNENQICLISTGPISYNVYLAIRNLNLNILHIHIPFVKNLDSNDLIKLSQNSNMIYIFEEHSVIGGLYSLCSEIFIKSTEFQKKQIFNYGINDCFIHKYGSQEEIWEQLYLDSNSIKKIILNR